MLRQLGMITAVWVPLCLAAYAFGSSYGPLYYSFMAALLLGLLLGLWLIAPLRDYWASLSGRSRAVITILTLATLFGQLVADSGRSFPFPRWDMYTISEAPERAVVHQVIGTTASGREFRVRPGLYIPSLGRSRYRSGIETLSERLRAEPEGAAEARLDLERMLKLLARAYNGRHESDPLTSIGVRRLEIEYRDPETAGHRRAESVYAVRIGGTGP